mgnify:CR=1 FL=1
MITNIQLELRPFTVPNYVVVANKARPRQDGMFFAQSGDNSFALRDLDDATLEHLCSEFREGVFKKAGRELPPEKC